MPQSTRQIKSITDSKAFSGSFLKASQDMKASEPLSQTVVNLDGLALQTGQIKKDSDQRIVPLGSQEDQKEDPSPAAINN